MEKEELEAAMGRNFQRAMANKDVRPKDIIDLTGASSSTVGNWRRRGVSREFAVTVAEFLGVKPDQISSMKTGGMYGNALANLRVDPEVIERGDPDPELMDLVSYSASNVFDSARTVTQTDIFEERRAKLLWEMTDLLRELTLDDLDLIKTISIRLKTGNIPRN